MAKIEDWHRRAAKAIDDYNLGMLNRDAIAQLIADHAPAEITVDAGLLTATKAMILLVEDYEAKTCKVIRAAITIGKSDWQAEAKERELAMHKMFEFLDVLRAALKAAGGGKND